MKKLQSLAAWLAVGALVSACGGGGGGGGDAGAPAATPSPAPGTSTGASADTCAAFKSGSYRVLDMNGTDPFRNYLINYDAKALTYTLNGSTGSMTAVSGSSCAFAVSNGTKMVSPGGAVVYRYDAGGASRVALEVPAQSATLADLAGTWSMMEFSRSTDSGPYALVRHEVTVGSNGAVTAGLDCTDTTTPCTAWAATGANYAANADGGFDFRRASGDTPTRVYLTTNGAGQKMMVGLLPGARGLLVGTLQTALALPAVNSATSYWEVALQNSGTATAVFPDTATVLSQPTTDSYAVRLSDGHTETWTINNPRTGLRHRPTSTGSTSNGGGVTVVELAVLPITGFGLDVYELPKNNGFMGFYVQHP